MVQSVAPGPQTYIACYYYTKQYKVKTSTRENDAVRRHCKHKICEAASGVTWHTVLQQTLKKLKEYNLTIRSVVYKYSNVYYYQVCAVYNCAIHLYDSQRSRFAYTSITTHW